MMGSMGIYFYQKLQKQLSFLSQELQQQQSLKGQIFSHIHNHPLQLLAFLMRELQSRDVPPEELCDYLQEIYTELQTTACRIREE